MEKINNNDMKLALELIKSNPEMVEKILATKEAKDLELNEVKSVVDTKKVVAIAIATGIITEVIVYKTIDSLIKDDASVVEKLFISLGITGLITLIVTLIAKKLLEEKIITLPEEEDLIEENENSIKIPKVKAKSLIDFVNEITNKNESDDEEDEDELIEIELVDEKNNIWCDEDGNHYLKTDGGLIKIILEAEEPEIEAYEEDEVEVEPEPEVEVEPEEPEEECSEEEDNIMKELSDLKDLLIKLNSDVEALKKVKSSKNKTSK
jgi:hypothetical protein